MFCDLLTRFNVALSDRHATLAHGRLTPGGRDRWPLRRLTERVRGAVPCPRTPAVPGRHGERAPRGPGAPPGPGVRGLHRGRGGTAAARRHPADRRPGRGASGCWTASLAVTYADWFRLRGEDPYDQDPAGAGGPLRPAGVALPAARAAGCSTGSRRTSGWSLVLRVYEGVAEEQTAAQLGLPVERVRAPRCLRGDPAATHACEPARLTGGAAADCADRKEDEVRRMLDVPSSAGPRRA